jgi:hypothetical protein
MKFFSPIAFRSNLYPLKPNINDLRMDKDFLMQIRERKAIKRLHDEISSRRITEFMYRPIDIQEEIYKRLVVTPYACELYPEIQPWGVILVGGKEKVVCKCGRTNCPGYKYCKDYIYGHPVKDLNKEDNSQKARMDEWYHKWDTISHDIEEIKVRYNAIQHLDKSIILKIREAVGKADEKSKSLDLWLKNLSDLDEKEDIKKYNEELANKNLWLNDITNLKKKLEDKRIELIKYRNMAQASSEFHSNWIKDWSSLQDEAKTLINDLPAERFVSDLPEKVSSLTRLVESGNLLLFKHIEKQRNHQDFEKECSRLLARIQGLVAKIDRDFGKIQGLVQKELTGPEESQNGAGRQDSKLGTELRYISNEQLFDSFKQVGQDEFIKLPLNSRILVNAGPGRGKTYSLIERIIHLVKNEGVDVEDITVLCFSRTAVAEVRKRIQTRCEDDEDLQGRNWQIGTIDSYCWMLTHSDDEQTDWKKIAEDSYDAGIQNAINLLRRGDNLLREKYIIVDEIQDIIDVRGEFILELLTHLKQGAGFALLGDFCQSIYDFQLTGKKGVLTSSRFFRKLYNIPKISKLSFSHNYRSDAESSLNKKLDELRPALINEDADSATRQISDIKNSQTLSEVSLDNIIDSAINDEIEGSGKTSGILVWKNAEVTEIASRFYEHMFDMGTYIPIHIQKRKNAAYLAGWIGIFFQNYTSDRIDKESFVEFFESIFTDEIKHKLNIRYSASYYWEAIEQCMADDSSYYQGKYEVEKILRNLVLKAWSFRENCGVLLSGVLPDSSIIISNVHQSKGREYDQVFLMKNLLDVSSGRGSKSEKNENCRVAYVALSRSKGDVYIFDEEESSFSYIWKSYKKRAYVLTPDVSTNKRLMNIEFGLYGDMELSSFANAEVQAYIRDFLPIGELLQLNKKIIQNDKQKRLAYDLVIDGGDPEVPDIIGKASPHFLDDLTVLMQKITNLNRPELEDYPKTIDNLYVNDVITIIEKDMGQGNNLKKFGNMLIWNGLSILGMGHCNYSY